MKFFEEAYPARKRVTYPNRILFDYHFSYEAIAIVDIKGDIIEVNSSFIQTFSGISGMVCIAYFLF